MLQSNITLVNYLKVTLLYLNLHIFYVVPKLSIPSVMYSIGTGNPCSKCVCTLGHEREAQVLLGGV